MHRDDIGKGIKIHKLGAFPGLLPKLPVLANELPNVLNHSTD